MVNLVGLCSVCNKPSRTLYTCWRCGANVCATDFDSGNGLCVRCSGQVGR